MTGGTRWQREKAGKKNRTRGDGLAAGNLGRGEKNWAGLLLRLWFTFFFFLLF